MKWSSQVCVCVLLKQERVIGTSGLGNGLEESDLWVPVWCGLCCTLESRSIGRTKPRPKLHKLSYHLALGKVTQMRGLHQPASFI